MVGRAWAARRREGAGAPAGRTTGAVTAVTARSGDTTPPVTTRTRIVSLTGSDSSAQPCESVALVPTVRQTPPSRDWKVTVCQGIRAPVAVTARALTCTRPSTSAVEGVVRASVRTVGGCSGHEAPVQVRPCPTSSVRSASGWSVVTPAAPRSIARCWSLVPFAVHVPTKIPRPRAFCTVAAPSVSWRTSISRTQGRASMSAALTGCRAAPAAGRVLRVQLVEEAPAEALDDQSWRAVGAAPPAHSGCASSTCSTVRADPADAAVTSGFLTSRVSPIGLRGQLGEHLVEGEHARAGEAAAADQLPASRVLICASVYAPTG